MNFSTSAELNALQNGKTLDPAAGRDSAAGDEHLPSEMAGLVEAHRALLATYKHLEEQTAERLQAEEDLRQSEETFRALAENLPDEISRFDRDFRYLYTNRRRGMFLGKTLDESGYPEELVVLWKAQFQKAFDTGRPGLMEYQATAENGSRCYFQARLAPEFTPEGEVGSVLFVARDITLRRQAEESAEICRAKAERADDAKSESLLCLRRGLEALLQVSLDIARPFGSENPQPGQRVGLDEICERIRCLLEEISRVLADSSGEEAGR